MESELRELIIQKKDCCIGSERRAHTLKGIYLHSPALVMPTTQGVTSKPRILGNNLFYSIGNSATRLTLAQETFMH